MHFRRRLTDDLNSKYIAGNTFYQVANLDSRIDNVYDPATPPPTHLPPPPPSDQRLTQDVDKWATSLSLLYSNLSKPLLDIVLFSRRLALTVGAEGPSSIIFYYIICGAIIRAITPPFGKVRILFSFFFLLFLFLFFFNSGFGDLFGLQLNITCPASSMIYFYFKCGHIEALNCLKRKWCQSPVNFL
jgi:hypothetical protein